MKRLIIALFAVLAISACCPNANAEQVVFNIPGDLTDAQERIIHAAAVEALSKAPVSSIPGVPVPTTPDEIEKWGHVFNAIGTGIANTAKQLGIEANAFAKTPLGILTILLVVWNYAGQELITIAFGTVWLLVALPTWVSFYRRIGLTSDVSYEKGKGPNGERRVRKYETHGHGESRALHVIMLILITAVGLISIVA